MTNFADNALVLHHVKAFSPEPTPSILPIQLKLVGFTVPVELKHQLGFTGDGAQRNARRKHVNPPHYGTPAAVSIPILSANLIQREIVPEAVLPQIGPRLSNAQLVRWDGPKLDRYVVVVWLTMPDRVAFENGSKICGRGLEAPRFAVHP